MSKMVFTPKLDFVGQGSTYDKTYGNFGVTAYQNRETLSGGNDVALSSHIQGFVEMGAGAHYYSQGIYSNLYRKAETTIDLSEIMVERAKRRVACISLGVVGLYGACDMGIEIKDDGNSWRSHYWSTDGIDDNGVPFGQGKDGVAVSGASKVTITVTPYIENNKDCVKGEYVWFIKVDDTEKIIKKEELILNKSQGALFDTDGNGNTWQRFHRFMSLIPRDDLGYSKDSDIVDQSYLTNGNLKNNKLYLADGSSVTWGTNLMDYIWSVQGWNITEFSPGNDDLFSCKHEHYVYDT